MAALMSSDGRLCCDRVLDASKIFKRLERERAVECHVTAGVVRILPLVVVSEEVWAAWPSVDILLPADPVLSNDVETLAVEVLDEVVDFRPIPGQSSRQSVCHFRSHVAIATLRGGGSRELGKVEMCDGRALLERQSCHRARFVGNCYLRLLGEVHIVLQNEVDSVVYPLASGFQIRNGVDIRYFNHNRMVLKGAGAPDD